MTDRSQVARNIQENVIVKSYLDTAFSNDENIRIPKTGAEMISKLESILLLKNNSATQLYAAVTNTADILPSDPQDDVYEDQFSGYKDQILFLYPLLDKRFSYKMCDWRIDKDPALTPRGYSEVIEDGSPCDEQTASMCKAYNSLVDKCITSAVETMTAKTLIDNISPEKTYMLDFKQIKSLGI